MKRQSVFLCAVFFVFGEGIHFFFPGVRSRWRKTMKRHMLTFLVVVCLSQNAVADLSIVGVSEPVVYDNISGLYWYQDLSVFTSQTYAEQLATIASIAASNYGGTNGWKMASRDQMETLYLNGVDAINDNFLRTAIGPNFDFMFGRYDESHSPDSHYLGGLDYSEPGISPDPIFLSLGVHGSWDGGVDPHSGAWAVAVVPVPPLEATIDILADTVTPKTKWIKCRIWPPDGYSYADIDVESILLEWEIPVSRYSFNERKQKLVVMFPASGLNLETSPDPLELTISGELTDGTVFEGSDFVTVVSKSGKKK